MYTTTISPVRAWLVDPLDPTFNPIVVGTRRSADWTDALDGEVREYSGNVKKAIGYLTTLEQIPIILVSISAAQLVQLRAWKGRVLLLRTVQGERMFCTFYQASVHDHLRISGSSDGRAFTVTISFVEVTYDESV